MDTSHTLNGVLFCWDNNKATANLHKHGVSFTKACEAFFDPFVKIVDASANGEQRDAAIGFSEDYRLLFVVHVVKRGDTIRLISARPATLAERKLYENY